MRGHVRPLSDHSQLEIIRTQVSESGEDAVIEYRVQNFSRRKEGTIQRGDGMSWIDVIWLAGLVMAWRSLDMGLQARQVLLRKSISVSRPSVLRQGLAEVKVPAVAWLIFALLFLFRKTRTVLYGKLQDSVHGVELTTRIDDSIARTWRTATSHPRHFYRTTFPILFECVSPSDTPFDHIRTGPIGTGIHYCHTRRSQAVESRVLSCDHQAVRVRHRGRLPSKSSRS